MQERLLLDWLCQAGQHGCDPIIPFYKIQKVNSLLGHTAYRRINNIQSAQER